MSVATTTGFNPDHVVHSGNQRKTRVHAHVDIEHTAKRHAGIFKHLDIPESVDAGSDEGESTDDCTDTESNWEYVAPRLAESISGGSDSTSKTCVAQTELSAAQAIVAHYRAAQLEEACSRNEVQEKDLPQIPDDARSMYTLASSPAEAQSGLDMLWRPEPKVRLRRNDNQDLAEAQSEALLVMHRVGLSPTDKIYCQRPNCSDLLRNVDALKYHIHIHNIGDAVDALSTRSSVTSCTTLGSDASHRRGAHNARRRHMRSKTSVEAPTPTHHKTNSSIAAFPVSTSKNNVKPRTLSPRGSPDSLAHSLAVFPVSPCSPGQARALSPSPRSPTPSRGRRTRKDTMTSSNNSHGYNASIAAILSPPTSPAPSIRGRSVLTPQANLPFVTSPHHKGLLSPRASPERDLKKATNPMRALSPARAMSPIRDGLRRVLSIGCLNGP
ncbi:hypothetical protein BV22DRAFT_1194850 [Leucogyrophana mollusca]|uniref:Uncharacterized protein n=1 Tax=Leucogyrophana mollusca TaxID=85980 RepID=A0ACB8BKD5_9AGAM|nr:hypothetical protein BV22DRAFT_1194850 [Leucogyrophana mollusca]